jgi:hypothetical protein
MLDYISLGQCADDLNLVSRFHDIAIRTLGLIDTIDYQLGTGYMHPLMYI